MVDDGSFLVASCNWFVSKSVRFASGISRLGSTSNCLKMAQCPTRSRKGHSGCVPIFLIVS